MVCQVEKNKKSEKNSDWSSPTHPPIQFWSFFGNIWKHQNNTRNTKKHKISKKIQIRVGAWPTHPLSSFSRIFRLFSTWQNPLARIVLTTPEVVSSVFIYPWNKIFLIRTGFEFDQLAYILLKFYMYKWVLHTFFLTRSCVSLPRPTTSSEEKIYILAV